MDADIPHILAINVPAHGNKIKKYLAMSNILCMFVPVLTKKKIKMSYSNKELTEAKKSLIDGIIWTDTIRSNSTTNSMDLVNMGNQKAIMKALKLLLDALPIPFDPGPNG